MSSTNAIEHKITTTDDQPVFTRQYRFPPAHKDEITKQIGELIDGKIIEPSDSPYSSPLWIVPKKADSQGRSRWRMVIDYRILNEKTIGDAYPLPNITEILDQLGSAKYFSVFDLAGGFHQIPVNPQDAHKTAFTTPFGHYQFSRMPFGLRNAPATFQRLMDRVLCGLQGTELFVYLHDVVLYASSLREHEIKFKRLAERLRQACLKLQPDKCEFLRKEVGYLGHVISKDGVRPDPKKLEAIRNYPRPTSPTKIKQFLGLAGYYRRFINNFSGIARPLTQLLKKESLFKWTETQEKAFAELRDSLCKEPVLQHPDFTKPFIITTDASATAIGGVISQGAIGSDRPIAYASRTLNKAEEKYPVIEKECLAIVYCVNYFRPYVYGREFSLVTDHKPLVWLHSVKDPANRLVAWRFKLENYQYKIIYKPGRANSNADALSRNPLNNNKSDTMDNIPWAEIQTSISQYLGDLPLELTICNQLVRVPPEEERRGIIEDCHDSLIEDHKGVTKTYKRIRENYFWTNMKAEVQEYIQHCRDCQLKKLVRVKTKQPMMITDTPGSAFDKVAMDIVGPFPVTRKGSTHILTIQDILTKYSLGIPMQRTTAVDIADAFVKRFVARFGAPRALLTDQGTSFCNSLMNAVAKKFRIRQYKTTSFHPQSNGSIERSHHVLVEYLKPYLDRQNYWDEFLEMAMFSYNTS